MLPLSFDRNARVVRSILLTISVSVVFAGCPGPSETWEVAEGATESGWLLSVWGPEGTDVRYAAGGTLDNDGGSGTLLRYESGAWQEMVLPAETPLLNWVYGFAADDVFVAGLNGVMLHWDGTAFTSMPTPTDEWLWGVWGAAPDDVWAVGGGGRTEDEAVILHYDGSAWTQVEVPPLERAGVRAFFKVWGSGPNDVVIVGQRGIILRWDGTRFHEQGAGLSDDLISVWGTDADHVVAVGGRGNGVVARWDGTEWRNARLSPLPGLNGVWLRGDTIHAVGILGTIARIDFQTLTYEVDPTDATLDFHAIFGDGTERLTAVGGDLALGPSAAFRGLAYERMLGAGE